MINFKVFMNPVAKARARTVVNNGRVHSYTPQSTKDAENAIAWACVEEQNPDCYPKGIALKMTIVFVLPKPKYLGLKPALPTKKPDLDNLTKTVLDALNGLAYEDDSQIVELILRKEYGIIPLIEITIEEVLC